MGVMGSQLRDSRDSMRQVFSNAGLRKLAIALIGSVMGDWAYSLAIAVYVYGEGGPTAVGVLAVVRYLLISAVLPFSSTFADKYDRKKIMVITDGLRFVLVLLAALLVWIDVPALVIYVLATISTLCGTPFKPAERSLTPDLVRSPAELTGSNVVSSTIDSVAMFVGPAIAGLLLAVTDIPIVFVFNALTFLWSGIIVASIVVPPKSDATSVDADGPSVDAEIAEPEEGLLASASHGYRLIFRNRDIRLMIGLYCAQTVVAGASGVFVVVVALDLLDIGKGGLGMLEAVLGLGGLGGGFVALMAAQRGRLATDFGVGVLLWTAPLLLLAAVPHLWAAILMMVLIGIGNSVVDVNALTILQRLVPRDSMGRVFGAMESAIILAMAVGALAMPILINTAGIRWGLLVIGGATTVVTLMSTRALRRIDFVALAPEGLELIRSVPIFRVLPAVTVERLARSSSVVTFPAGSTVFSEGDPGDRFYVIESGTVDVTIRGEHTRQLAAGDSFGEIALLRNIPRTATITATSDLVLRAMESEPFVSAVTNSGEAADQAEQIVTSLLQAR